MGGGPREDPPDGRMTEQWVEERCHCGKHSMEEVDQHGGRTAYYRAEDEVGAVRTWKTAGKAGAIGTDTNIVTTHAGPGE